MTKTALNQLRWHSGSKIVIVGTSGAGKTFLAQEFARRFGLADIELDALYWGPEWTPVAAEEFRARVAGAIAAAEGWVVHGNYSKVRDLAWAAADVILWLDYPRHVVWPRILRRTWARVWDGQELWNGNRETFRKAFLSRESVIVWSLKTFTRNRRGYAELMRGSEYGHKMVRVAHPRQMRALWG